MEKVPPFHEPDGVRPSSGAETHLRASVWESAETAGRSHLAAPEDGRTPAQGSNARL